MDLTTAERIKRRRKELNLTLEQVGDAVGVGKSTVRKWETGMIANMKRDKMAALAKVLQMSPIELFGLDDSITQESRENVPEIKPVYPSYAAEILPVYSRLNARGRGKVLDYANDLSKSPDYTDEYIIHRTAARGGGVQDKVMTRAEYDAHVKKVKELPDIHDPRL